MRRVARLYGDDELRVLWLTMGRQELALSVDGVWLRSGRRTADLAWDEIDQVQFSAVGARWLAPRVRVEIFRRDGAVHTVGPFPSAAAERWLRACAQAAREHGERIAPVQGGDGFALAARSSPQAVQPAVPAAGDVRPDETPAAGMGYAP